MRRNRATKTTPIVATHPSAPALVILTSFSAFHNAQATWRLQTSAQVRRRLANRRSKKGYTSKPINVRHSYSLKPYLCSQESSPVVEAYSELWVIVAKNSMLDLDSPQRKGVRFVVFTL